MEEIRQFSKGKVNPENTGLSMFLDGIKQSINHVTLQYDFIGEVLILPDEQYVWITKGYTLELVYLLICEKYIKSNKSLIANDITIRRLVPFKIYKAILEDKDNIFLKIDSFGIETAVDCVFQNILSLISEETISNVVVGQSHDFYLGEILDSFVENRNATKDSKIIGSHQKTEEDGYYGHSQSGKVIRVKSPELDNFENIEMDSEFLEDDVDFDVNVVLEQHDININTFADNNDMGNEAIFRKFRMNLDAFRGKNEE